MSIAKAANVVRRAVKLISAEILSRWFAGAGKRTRVKPMLRCRMGKVGFGNGIRSIEATVGGPGRVMLNEGGQEWPGLSQENGAQMPSPNDSVQNPTGVTQQRASSPNRELVHHGCNPAMFAGPTDVPVIPSQVVCVHLKTRNLPGKGGARP